MYIFLLYITFDYLVCMRAHAHETFRWSIEIKIQKMLEIPSKMTILL